MNKQLDRIFLKAIKAEEGKFKVLASTDAIDRAGEVIDQKGWMLENFLKNPVILFGHDYWSFPIGKATSAVVEAQGLIIEGEFAPTEGGQEAKILFEGGFLSAVSVGFIPHERNANIITKAELLELSFVPVPCNQEALALSVAKGFKTNILKEFEDKKKELGIKDEPTDPAEPKEDEVVIDETQKIFSLKQADGKLLDPISLVEGLSEKVKEQIASFKAGRVLSDKNRKLIGDAISNFESSISVLRELLNATNPDDGKNLPSGEKEKRSGDGDGLIAIPESLIKELLNLSREADKRAELSNAILKSVLAK